MLCLLLCTMLALAYPTQHTDTPLGTVAWLDARDRGAPDQAVAVFVHGLPTSKELWIDVLDAMPEQPAIAVDLLDFGESRARDAAALDHKQRAAALDALLDALGLERVVLIAHDLGASVAVDYMAAHGARVERLVLMSSPVYPDFNEPAVVDLVRRRWLGMPLLRIAGRAMFRATLKKGLYNEARYTAREDALFRRDYSGAEGKRRMWRSLSWGTPEVFFADYPDIMKGISVPTLLLHGAQDPFIPLIDAHRMDADIADSELIIIDKAAHFIPLDVPQQVADALTAFLAPR